VEKPNASTLKELKKSGWISRSVRDEMRENLMAALQSGNNLFPGIVGYDKTVIPQLENAILSKHHFILLGLRGQAKSRIIRQLFNLLDEYTPVIAGTALNEDPLNPITPQGQRLATEMGDDLPIDWLHRTGRFHEKLATPDVSIADLIGDIDPIKAARDRLDISNEEVINWGIIPRTNRGIFAINELPDLQPRIQVGLLNILEESEIQVRGFPIRVPLDMVLVFTANPEDYTNRGNIITPLKDRIDSQIKTHYPRSIDEAKKITAQEIDKSNARIEVPEFIRDIIEEVSFQARQSEYVDQTSGVSARVSISAYEILLSNIQRRALQDKDKDRFPRMTDLYLIVPAITGKIELVYEGEQEGSVLVARRLIGQAITQVFTRHFPKPSKDTRNAEGRPVDNPYEAVIDYFSTGRKLVIADDMRFSEYKKAVESVIGLKEIVKRYFGCDGEREALLRMELVLDALHHFNMIDREEIDSIVQYGDIFSSMFRGSDDVR
jgi:magnesium chelatase subunit I